jgi:hypothetical protein
MALSQLLISSETRMTASDPEWYQFIVDHRDYLCSTAATHQVSLERAHGYRFAPYRYLAEVALVPSDTIWIVLLINDLQDPQLFYTAMTLYLPDAVVLTNLQEKFNNSQHTLKNSTKSLTPLL